MLVTNLGHVVLTLHAIGDGIAFEVDRYNLRRFAEGRLIQETFIIG